MIELTFSMVTGLISGIISSLSFFWSLSLMKPKLAISATICKGSDDIGTYYGFKVLNLSRYNVLDLRAEVVLKTPFNSNGGHNYSSQWINLKKENILMFPRYKKDSKHADYALILATRDDLENLWKSSAQYLTIQIHGRHAFSGITKSFEQKYYTKKNCIEEGMFNFGTTFEIS